MKCVAALGPLLVSLRTMMWQGFLFAVQRIVRCVWSPIYFRLIGAQTLAGELPIASLLLGSTSACVVHRGRSQFGGLVGEFATPSFIHVSWGN